MSWWVDLVGEGHGWVKYWVVAGGLGLEISGWMGGYDRIGWVYRCMSGWVNDYNYEHACKQASASVPRCQSIELLVLDSPHQLRSIKSRWMTGSLSQFLPVYYWSNFLMTKVFPSLGLPCKLLHVRLYKLLSSAIWSRLQTDLLTKVHCYSLIQERVNSNLAISFVHSKLGKPFGLDSWR